jgi:prevent-host-death family protein
MKLSDVKSISYVKANAAAVLDKVAASREPLGITQHGEIKAVMVGAEEYQRTQDTLAFLKLAALGEDDIAQGNVRPLGDFVQAMRAELAGK